MTSKDIVQIQTVAIRAYIKEKLMEFYSNRLEDKGFDFFFVLSNDLENLNKKVEKYKIEKK